MFTFLLWVGKVNKSLLSRFLNVGQIACFLFARNMKHMIGQIALMFQPDVLEILGLPGSGYWSNRHLPTLVSLTTI